MRSKNAQDGARNYQKILSMLPGVIIIFLHASPPAVAPPEERRAGGVLRTPPALLSSGAKRLRRSRAASSFLGRNQSGDRAWGYSPIGVNFTALACHPERPPVILSRQRRRERRAEAARPFPAPEEPDRTRTLLRSCGILRLRSG
jgi:hypothetical protein